MLWEQILARKREFRRIPDARTPAAEYLDPEGVDPDKFYQRRAALIDGFTFDWQGYRIPKATFECTDVSQWLALEVARRALEDASYKRETVPRERTGVFVGNTNTGEQSRARALRVRWPFVRKLLITGAKSAGASDAVAERVAQETESRFKHVLPAVTEDFGAGNIGATIAGRICNYFDLHGGGYVLDGACASSLVAVHNLCTLLQSHDVDLGIAGGVDIVIDPFELVGFARAGAMARKDINPFDRKAAGFISGEGCGFVVLKRLEDARAAGDYVYAVIRGWGMSSDGKGGIMQPTEAGQANAMNRAYDRAGYTLRDVAFVEAHGTGTKIGDLTELKGLARVLGEAGGGGDRSIGVGSIKSNIGHTKAASGIAGLIKAILAANRRVLPPTTAIDEPSSAFEDVARSFYPLLHGQVLRPDAKIRAGVSAFGFGGINSHVTLESADAPSPRLAPPIEERALLVSAQDTELFVFAAESVDDLAKKISFQLNDAGLLSEGDLVDLSALLAEEANAGGPVRAALFASTPDELEERLRLLLTVVHDAGVPDDRIWTNPKGEVFLGRTIKPARVGFLFPGQGSQQINAARVLVERFEWAREMLELANQCAPDVGLQKLLYRPMEQVRDLEQLRQWEQSLADTSVAQPAICFASALYVRFLEELGIRPSAVAGHSLGELSAFYCAGAFHLEWLMRLAFLRGRAMQGAPGQAGAMASLSCPVEVATGLVQEAPGLLVIANVNSHRQVVVSGEEAAVADCVRRASDAGIEAKRLPVSNAFHSPLVKKAGAAIRAQWSGPRHPVALKTKLFSTVEGAPVEIGGSAVLPEHFASQVTAPVNFVRVVHELGAHCDLIFEVGPGRVLSALNNDIQGEKGPRCQPVAGSSKSQRDLLGAVALAFVHGVPLNLRALHARRLVRPYVSPQRRQFIESPTERPFPQADAHGQEAPLRQSELEARLETLTRRPAAQLSAYFKNRLPFIAEVIKADLATGPQVRSMGADATVQEPPPAPMLSDGPAGEHGADPVESLLLDMVAARTGYSRSGLSLQARILDDLNLDSIKAGELISAVAKQLGVVHLIDPTKMANARLEEVVKALKHVQRGTPPAVSARQAPVAAPALSSHASAPPTSIEELLFDLVEKRTGYKRAAISLSSRLLDDLNLDSIKAGDLVSAAAKEVGKAGRIEPSKFANASLAEIVAALGPANGDAAGANRSPPAPASVASDQAGRVRALLMSLVESRTGYSPGSIRPESRLLDDLNLDSIKAGDLVATAAKSLGVAGRVEANKYANAAINEVEQALVLALGESSPASFHREGAPTPASHSSLLDVVLEEAQRLTGFPRAGLNAATHVSRDLNLNPPKITRLIDACFQSLGLTQAVDIQPFEDRTLGQIADVLRGIRNRRERASELPANTSADAWVRNFGVEYIERPLTLGSEHVGQRREDDWKEALVLVVCDDSEADLAEAMRRALTGQGAAVEVSTFEEVRRRALGKASGYSHLIGIFPRSPVADADARAKISSVMGRLLAIGAPPDARLTRRRRVTVAYLQWGGGWFGTDATPADISVCCATGFARSLHLERSDLRVRVVDFAPTLPDQEIVESALAEIRTSHAFMAAGYDENRVRRVERLVLHQPDAYPERSVQFGENEVVLVTGGGKGVTAECALALAQRHRCQFVLVGRTRHLDTAEGGEVARTLERFQALGIRCQYLPCDVADAQQVDELVRDVQSRIGAIVAVIHGAMVIRPGRVENLTVDGTVAEVSPKVLGAINLCRALEAHPPKLFVVLTSIVAHQGMPWSAAYAYSNEALDLVMRRFHARHPETQVQAVAFGVWGQVGGAVRIGTTEHLAGVGLDVGEIAASEGVARFVQLVERDPGAAHVVVTTRCSGFKTWKQLRDPVPAVPKRRFMEELIYLEPGVELIARARIRVDVDTYLQRYQFRGSYLLPAVFQQEAVVEAALQLTGTRPELVSGMRDLVFPWPITIDPESGTEIEIWALVEEQLSDGRRVISTRIRSEQSNFTKDCFSAKVLLGTRVSATRSVELGKPLAVDAQQYLKVSRYFFDDLMRLGPIFSTDSSQSVWHCTSSEEAASGRAGFANDVGPLALGDPYFREAMHQTAVLSMRDVVFTPKRVEEVTYHGGFNSSFGKKICVAITKRAGGEFVSEMAAVSEDGAVVESVRGFVGFIHQRESSESSVPKEASPQVGVQKPAEWESFSPPDSTPSQTPTHWVRQFAVGKRPAPMPSPSLPASMYDRAVIVFEPGEAELAEAVGRELTGSCRRVERCHFSDLNALTDGGTDSSALAVAILPRPGGRDGAATQLRRMLGRLLSWARAIPEDYGRRAWLAVEWAAPKASLESTGVKAFARSLHLERPKAKIRVVEAHPSSSPSELGRAVSAELMLPDPFGIAIYDAKMMRAVPQLALEDPSARQLRPLKLAPHEVILVTGGAGGITAECCLELAKHTKAGFALVGRRAPEAAAVRDTLARFEAAGVRCRYYACDVRDAGSVTGLVARVQKEMGLIGVVIHGAMTATVAKLEACNVEPAMEEVSAKVLGAAHLCEALRPSPPKLWVGLSSISQVQGMPGTAPYAYSNEAMALLLEAFGEQHPETQICIASFGLWKDVGISARANSKSALERLGLRVDDIDPFEGAKRFVDLCLRDTGGRHIVVTAGSQGFAPWTQQRTRRSPAPGGHFIERVLVDEPGVELVARRRLTIEGDAYLTDHIYKGMYILPTVFALEAAAEAARYLMSETGGVVRAIEKIEMPWPIIVSPQSGEEIEIRAVACESKEEEGYRVQVSIRSEQSAFTKDYVVADVIVGSPRSEESEPVALPSRPLPIAPASDLYGRNFFVGPLFQRMQSIYSVARERAVALVKHDEAAAAGKRGLKPAAQTALAIGDPYFRDCVLHCAYLHDLRRSHAFTKRIERIEIFPRPAKLETALCTAKVTHSDASGYEVELTAADQQGRVVERVHGFRLQVLQEHPEWPASEMLAQPDVLLVTEREALRGAVTDGERQMHVAAPTLNLHYRPGLKAHQATRRHELEREFVLASARDAFGGPSTTKASVDWEAAGNPVLKGLDAPAYVSLSHDDPYCICALGREPQGCDITSLRGRSKDEWSGLLGPGFATVLEELTSKGDSPDTAGARLWCAMEAFRKWSGQVDVELTLQQVERGPVLLTARGGGKTALVLTTQVQLARGPARMVATVVTRERAETAVAPTAQATPTQGRDAEGRVVYDESLSSQVVASTRTVTWRDCNSGGGNVQAGNYVLWFKELCDLMLAQVGKPYVSAVRSGAAGGVARWTEAQFFTPATAYDVLQAKAWIASFNSDEVMWEGEFRDRARNCVVAKVRGAGVPVRAGPDGRLSPHALPEEYARVYRPFVAPGEVQRWPAYALQGRPRGRLSSELPAGAPIHTHTLTPTPVDSDLLGNINSVSYLLWCAAALDLFVHQTIGAPATDAGGSVQEGWVARWARIDYLRDLRPFERVEVRLAPEEVTDLEARLRFDFVRLGPQGTVEKIAVARFAVAWATISAARGEVLTSAWPDRISSLLLRAFGEGPPASPQQEAPAVRGPRSP